MGCGPGQMLGPALTLTPTSTSTLTATSAPTSTPTLTPTPSLTPTPTLTAGEQAHLVAETGVTANADWTPYTEEINGVLMTLVPVGCFRMGITDEQVADVITVLTGYLGIIRSQGPTVTKVDPTWFADEQPAHKVCFEQPFWIDVTEVTNSQWETFGGEAECEGHWSDADRPRDATTWTESDAFCRKRGARLPTEAEWEYAARGPDGLIYPWGNTWDGALLVWNSTHAGLGSKVGDGVVESRPGGVSWVGAYDMAGNVAEWVNDWFSETYYAMSADGAVNPQENGISQTLGSVSGAMHPMRGGEWYDSLPAFAFRSAFRARYLPDKFSSTVGFRCAMSY